MKIQLHTVTLQPLHHLCCPQNDYNTDSLFINTCLSLTQFGTFYTGGSRQITVHLDIQDLGGCALVINEHSDVEISIPLGLVFASQYIIASQHYMVLVIGKVHLNHFQCSNSCEIKKNEVILQTILIEILLQFCAYSSYGDLYVSMVTDYKLCVV